MGQACNRQDNSRSVFRVTPVGRVKLELSRRRRLCGHKRCHCGSKKRADRSRAQERARSGLRITLQNRHQCESPFAFSLLTIWLCYDDRSQVTSRTAISSLFPYARRNSALAGRMTRFSLIGSKDEDRDTSSSNTAKKAAGEQPFGLPSFLACKRNHIVA